MLQSVNTALSSVASVMETLTTQLVDLTKVFARTKTMRATEEEIGRLFVEAQGYVDRSLEDARRRADGIVESARFEAAEIVAEAKREAAEIVAAAKRPASTLPPDLAVRLASTIDVFHQANAALQHELSGLRATFAPPATEAAAPPPDPGTAVHDVPPPVAAPPIALRGGRLAG